MPTLGGTESVTSPVASTAATRQELPYRLRQQSLLGEFGRTALQTRDIGQILQRATELCAQGLETPFAKVLEYMPEEKRLLVSAGVGWAPETIGQISLGVDLEFPPAMRSIPAKLSFPTTFRKKPAFERPNCCRSTASSVPSMFSSRGAAKVISRLAFWKSTARTPANSTLRMPISLRALRACSASPSSGSRPTPSFKNPSSTRPC